MLPLSLVLSIALPYVEPPAEGPPLVIAGVTIIDTRAGTALPDRTVVIRGLHDELALMVKPGLSPAEALRTATVNPAKFLGRESSLGTIEPGKEADLVLLDGDPLADIAKPQPLS